ncbi:MAG TPA: thiamine pyrophosphate-binding protein [Candidatus Binataceae bacterium]|jgi:acetolactate synthase-1/2/3 large subunit|nr:thiamine pyrophosphate-binding protein [Candidatus Binataceae bacterium]
MAIVRGEQLIARCFKNESVDTIFFMMGGPTSGTAGACLELGMKGIYVRHEQAAAMMAHAYARVTGKPGICITPSGPGTANALTGLANAWADATPIIAIGGSAPMRATTLDAFQEMDQVAIMKPVVKAAYRVDMASRIPEYISVAFREALDGKKGPVYLDLPGDILNHKVDGEKLLFPANYRVESRPAGDPVQVERAIELLAGAERPIVVTGSGVLWSGASAELRDFIESTGLPFYTTPQGRGVIPEDHQRSFPGARSMAFREADVVLVVGARANSMLSFLRAPRFSPEARFISVNLDGREIGHNRAVEVGIIGDAKLVLRQLTEEADGRFEAHRESAWVAQLSAKHRSNQERSTPLLHSGAVPIHPLRLCREVRDVISRDTILIVDGHEILNFARQSIPIYQAGCSLNAGPHGCMGVGVPFGIGAKVARPEAPVVVLSGDGAFGWNGMEMDTAIRHQLPIVVVMSNNAGFTSRKTGGTVGRELGWQRYDKMVEALGGYGEFVEKPDDIRGAIERAFKSGKPALVNVCTDPEAQATTDMGFAGY